MNRNVLLALGIILTLAIVTISFFTLVIIPEPATDPGDIDKAEVLYVKANEFLSEGQINKAMDAFKAVTIQYPKSTYSEKSLRKLASFYMEKGETDRANIYYSRLIENFPDVKDAADIRSNLEKLNMESLLSPAVTGGTIEYIVQPGDSLYAIARKHNTTIALIKKMNGFQTDVIRPGQKLKVSISTFSIFVDKSDNILKLTSDGKLFKTYAVSTGKNNSTPVGTFKIEEKMVKPVWYTVGAIVSPDSKEYELGTRWMGLSIQGYGIHGTSDETTIGRQITQGCVRMKNVEVEELFDIVPSGTLVEIVD